MRHEENSRTEVLRKWEETLLTANDLRERLNAIAQLGQYGNQYTLDLLIEYTEVDQNPKILAAIEDTMVKIENRLTRPSNEPTTTKSLFTANFLSHRHLRGCSGKEMRDNKLF